MNTAKIDENGQLAIPANIRDRLAYAQGEELEIATCGRSLIVRPKKDMARVRRTLERYAGSMREQFLADGFTSTEDYMRFIRGDDYLSR